MFQLGLYKKLILYNHQNQKPPFSAKFDRERRFCSRETYTFLRCFSGFANSRFLCFSFVFYVVYSNIFSYKKDYRSRDDIVRYSTHKPPPHVTTAPQSHDTTRGYAELPPYRGEAVSRCERRHKKRRAARTTVTCQ
jgi:hypothetical protein